MTGILYIVAQPIATVSALTADQKRVYSSGINYFDVLVGCENVVKSTADSSNIEPGAGKPTGTTFPKLDPAAMGTAIDKYIQQTNPNSKMKGLGSTIVASSEKADINPFLVVAIAQKESQLSDPGDYNVKNGNNSFGRMATKSQPNFQGARLWYKWTSVKASVDHTAAENKNAVGGGDAAAYLRNQYGSELDAGQLESFMNKYAPPGDGNDTPKYIADIKSWMGKMAQLTGDAPAPAATASTPAAATAAGDGGGSVYMLGDSITVGAKSSLEKDIKEKGYDSVYINGSVSRSVTGKGTTAGAKTSGLEAVEDDKNRIKSADVVIIALGTNQNNDLEGSIKDIVGKVKAIKSGVRIYWVNTFSPKVDTEKINKSIDKLASSEGYKVIDTKGKGIEMGSDKIHPTEEGSVVFAKVVANGIGTGGEDADGDAPPDEAAECTCKSGGSSDTKSTSLVGSENAEKIFNYFVSNGLKPHQAAGIMGNMKAESGLNPRALEPGTTGDFPIEGRGYGLVQWTFAVRQQPLIKKAQQSGKKVYDLGVQLEYVLDELSGSHKSAGDNLKKTKTVEEATLVVELQYEIHAGGVQPQRTTDAKNFLAKYGSGTPSGGGSSSGGSVTECNDKESGSGGGDSSTAGPFTGTAQEAAKALLANKGVQIHSDRNLIQAVADGKSSPLDEKLIKMLAGLAKTHDFGISSLYRGPCSGSNHCTGKAADINPVIDGQTISYNGNNPKIQAFIDDAAKIMGGNCENGVPNQAYVTKTKANGSKCQVFVDIGTGPHVHLAVAS